MRFACLFVTLAAFSALSCGPVHADPGPAGSDQIVVSGIRENRSDWKRAESEHVVIFSDGSEAELKRVSNDLERLHQLMARLYAQDGEAGKLAKLRIILIDSTRDFRALPLRNLRSEEGPYASPFVHQRYYDPRDDGALLVVPRADQIIDLDTSRARDAACEEMAEALAAAEQLCSNVTTRPPPLARPWEAVLFSAYAQHFTLSYLPAGYPRWYLDGIGALFSTVAVRRGGALDYARISLANRQIFRSYGRLNAVDVLTGRYMEAPSRSMEWTPFHAALLVHFFVYSDLKPERQAQFGRYMAAVHQGVPMAEAATAFGDLNRLKREISIYAGRDGLTYARTEKESLPPQDPSITNLSLAHAAALEASIGLAPSVPADTLAYDSEAALLMAEADCRAGRANECLVNAEAVLVRSPDDARALGWKGIALTDEAVAGDAADRPTRLRAARAVIERAIALDGEAPVPLVAWFESYAKAGVPVPDAAMAAMAKAIRLVPAAPALRLSLGAELTRRGQPDLARKLLSPVLFGPYDTPERKQAEAMLAAHGTAQSPG